MNNEFISAIQTASDHARDVGAIKSIRTSSSIVEDHGLPFVVRVVENIARKERNAAEAKGNPFLPYDQDLFVAEISDTHVCLLNKFNVVDNHILMVTKQFESQQSLLSVADFEALWFGLKGMPGVVFYNSCEAAGASQKHKHLQMVPFPLGEEVAGAPVTECFKEPTDDEVICRSDELPFSHVYAQVTPPNGRSGRECAEQLRELYLAMLQTLRLWQPKAPDVIQPYNLLVTREWLWIVPRSNSHYQGIGINALGFAGTCLLKNREQQEQLEQMGPLAVLKGVTE